MTSKPHPSASLYVGDLANDVTEGMLFEIFNQVGPVASIRVCRDAVTRRSLHYAYVNFHSVVDAERALDTLNNTPIKGKPCRIMWSQRDPAVRKSGKGNVFIKNLDPEIGHKELHDTFSAFGNILSCKVAIDENGQSKGYGFVHFEDEETATKAINKVNGMMILSKKVFVGPFIGKKERLKNKEQCWTNVYVKNLPVETTNEKLEEMFEKYGQITSAVVSEDASNVDDPKKFGFLNFSTHEAAVRCVDDCAENPISNEDGSALFVGRAQKKAERKAELMKKFEQLKIERMTKYQGINLYIKNLEDDISEERLKKEFSRFGTIKSLKIMTDDKGNGKGFGFVCFSTPEEAQRTINEMNGRILQGCGKPLYVNMHEPKEVRRQKLAAQHAARAKGLRPTVAAPIPYGPGVFYPPQTGGVPQGFVYQHQMMPPRRWNQPHQQNHGYPHVPNNYGVMPMSRRGGRGSHVPQGGRRPRGDGRQMPQQQQQPAMQSPPPQQPPQQQQQPQQPPQQQDQYPQGEAQPLTMSVLNAYPPDQQKLIIGERLYPLVHKREAQLAGKITGMLLDSGYIDELLHLLEDEEALNTKIEEAVQVLEEAKKQASEDGDEEQEIGAREAEAPKEQVAVE